ncbi:unnamed protein product, partial [Cyprideis torosa]
MAHQGGRRSETFYERLSHVYVDIPSVNYGTSVQTVITVDQNDQVFYYERYRPSGGSGERWIACHVSFRLKAPSEGHEQSSS